MKRRWFFLFFFLSGFCSLVCEIVWLRLAMASFGVTTAIISIVLSVFMAGLAFGSWIAGKLTLRHAGWSASESLRLYGCAELLIGLSAIVVPRALKFGQMTLERMGSDIAWGSFAHHVASSLCVAVAILPFSCAMGATFPLAMASLRRASDTDSERSFSYLYLANLLGAVAGAIAAVVFLIELLGFRRTLLVAATLNVLVAAVATRFSFSETGEKIVIPKASAQRTGKPISADARAGNAMLGLMFLTGLTSMALEVIWVRQFTPFLGTVVYAFATILTVYLLASFAGSAIYRRWSASAANLERNSRMGVLWFATGTFALISLGTADPRMRFGSSTNGWIYLARVIVGLAPFCAAVGFLTPALIDRWARGNPERAGLAYAINVLGCIIGPLLASFVLLPWVGERSALIGLSVPMLAVGLAAALIRSRYESLGTTGRRIASIATVALLAAAAICMIALTRDFATSLPGAVVKRDATATVIATGKGMDKKLLVNGFGMTTLNTITKTMAHLPLAFMPERPRNSLVICFGMGTSFRSATTWGIPVTAVELIPSVPGLFDYYYADAAEVVSRPGARIVIDDGRRFLDRTIETYDVITVDPPPPVEAAGSSLLYSREFYASARLRLRPGGILQQWLPNTDSRVTSAVARAVRESFPYVRVFSSCKFWGLHFLASDRPIPLVSADELADRLPPKSASDIVEWELGYIPAGIFALILQTEIPIEKVVGFDPNAPTLSDDNPVNEYYLLHRLRERRSFSELMPATRLGTEP